MAVTSGPRRKTKAAPRSRSKAAPRTKKRSTSSRAHVRKPSVKKLEEKAAKNKPLPGPLTGNQKRHLRGLAHKIEPVILVGHKGITAPLVAEARQAIAVHELIKVKVGKNAPEEMDAAVDALVKGTGAQLVQVIGGIVVLYAPAEDPERRNISLPVS